MQGSLTAATCLCTHLFWEFPKQLQQICQIQSKHEFHDSKDQLFLKRKCAVKVFQAYRPAIDHDVEKQNIGATKSVACVFYCMIYAAWLLHYWIASSVASITLFLLFQSLQLCAHCSFVVVRKTKLLTISISTTLMHTSRPLDSPRNLTWPPTIGPWNSPELFVYFLLLKTSEVSRQEAWNVILPSD